MKKCANVISKEQSMLCPQKHIHTLMLEKGYIMYGFHAFIDCIYVRARTRWLELAVQQNLLTEGYW